MRNISVTPPLEWFLIRLLISNQEVISNFFCCAYLRPPVSLPSSINLTPEGNNCFAPLAEEMKSCGDLETNKKTFEPNGQCKVEANLNWSSENLHPYVFQRFQMSSFWNEP